ncbi:hypothetical protein [Sporosarcina sp. YIM B06819]|uniref:hypothetical protein n=1 Tax=Sporosarcina sp. YIM B06819 TaxID=3081769 RepID=UPI00298CF084|nr:hypothetical protein [Sporosarcina sp. YIM B06819]
MANNDFDKRMEFLKKSYNRLPSSFDPEEILQKIEEETNNPGKKEPAVRRKSTLRHKVTVWSVSIASVFLFGIITALFITEHNEKLASAAYIEKFQQDYAMEREKQRDILKLEEDNFGKLTFVQEADAIIDNIADDKEQAEANYELALSSLKLPSSMMKDIADQSLVEDEQASFDYLDSFFGKIRSLIAIYDDILMQNHQAIESFEMDPSIDKTAVMMLSPDTFPEELQNIIDTMRKQYIELHMEKDTGEITARYYAPRLAEKVKTKFHPATRGYATLALTRAGQLEGSDSDRRAEIANQSITLPNQHFEQQVKSLYEQFKTSHDKTIFKGLSLIYMAGVFNYANDMEDPETMYYLSHSDDITTNINQGRGYTIEEYITNWRKGRSLFKDTEQIVFSGDSLEQGAPSALSTTVQVNRKDGSSEDFYFVWGNGQEWQLFMQGLEPLPSSYSEPEIPMDKEFMARVHREYKVYTESNYQYDLPGVEAVIVVGLYFYAAEIGDYETQYSLYVQGEYGPPIDKETFIKEAALSPTVKFDEVYQSISFQADGNWDGLATLNLNPEHDTYNSKTHYFSMSHTDSGWRVNFLPMQ